MKYKYTKWFFDVQGKNGEYLIFFISLLQLGRKKKVYFQMHTNEKDREGVDINLHPVEITASHLKLKEGAVIFNDGRCKINLKSEGVELQLIYQGLENKTDSDHLMIGSKPGRRLGWFPRLMAASVSGHIQTPENTYTFDLSPGYIDEVTTNILPWKIPVDELIWGRLIHPDLSLSYSIIKPAGSTGFITAAYMYYAGRFFRAEKLSMQHSGMTSFESLKLSYPENYILELESGDLHIRLEIANHKICIVNDFMDYREQYGNLITWLLKKVSGNPRGIKFLAEADIEVRKGRKLSRMKKHALIDEYVKFR